FYALLPQYFDPQLKTMQELFRLPADFPIDPWLLVALQTVQAVLIAPIINGIFTFGEEFGWRGYLQPRLMSLGGRKTMLIMGVIWGVWHAPVIAMGHNYGLDYPGAPWLGMLAMTWFTLVSGIFLGWVTIRGGSVWPAVIGHAAINGISGLGIVAVKGEPNPLLGPLPVGIVASIGWTVAAAWIMLHPRALNSPEPALNPPERPA
ncbi:MAG: CPBP family intramembrane glutamic endopeptidase, partial [Anaerolineaceae bacterium]|nr:CPBP family intramembrane glutamic endopeptidase [Anaerolineaceae bacterium]